MHVVRNGYYSNTNKRSFDVAFKLREVEYVEQNKNKDVGRKFGVDENRRIDLQTLPAKKKRLSGGGCRAALPEMEEELAAWIQTLKAQNATL